MKLNDSNPQQHLMIVIFGGACIFLNIITAFKADRSPESESTMPRTTQSIDAVTGNLSLKETRYTNPELSWFQSIFCRGRQRSSSCSFRILHPFANEVDESEIPDGQPKQNHVVYYRGKIEKNSALSSNLTAPAAEDVQP